MLKSKTNTIKHWLGCGETGTPIYCWWVYKKNDVTITESCLAVSYKIKHNNYHMIQKFHCEVFYPTQMKTLIYKKNCTRLLSSSLFMLLKTGNNLNIHQQENG